MKKGDRVTTLALGMGVVIISLSAAFAGAGSQDTKSFSKDLAPLLVQKCQPCHFEGGKVFGKLPFTDYSTVKRLGLKLNTRLKKEEDQKLVKLWVASGFPK